LLSIKNSREGELISAKVAMKTCYIALYLGFCPYVFKMDATFWTSPPHSKKEKKEKCKGQTSSVYKVLSFYLLKEDFLRHLLSSHWPEQNT
jgi:hypothetical protein